MRKFLIIIILNLCFMPLSKADDIRDFQIEGMSIGDSALDFFSETKINNGLKNWYKDKTYNYSSISKPNFANKYEKIGFFYKPNDEKYIMVSISGIMFCKSDIRKCENMHTEVENEFNKLFKNIKKEKKVFSYPKTEANGEGSKAIQIFYKFKSGDQVVVETKDWASDSKYTDNFSISIDTAKFAKWLVVD